MGAEKVLLPVLSTGRMVQWDLRFAERTFTVADTSLRWSELRLEQQAPAAAAASLALWSTSASTRTGHPK